MLATDLNPGTSPIASMPVIIGLAVRRYGWSVREALLAATLNAAWVLGWSDELGSLEPGKRADVLVLDGPGRARPVPLRPQPGGGRDRGRRGRAGCGPTRRGGCARDRRRRRAARPARRPRADRARPPDGTTRLAWTPELAAAEAWFGEQARAAGLRVERDPAGSLWAVPDAPGPWWATGSHLDSVRGGGRFDGALGVAAGFAVAERARPASR